MTFATKILYNIRERDDSVWTEKKIGEREPANVRDR